MITNDIVLFIGNTSCQRITLPDPTPYKPAAVPHTQSVHAAKTKETKPSNVGAFPKENKTLPKVSSQQLDASKHVDLTPSWACNESRGVKENKQPSAATKNKSVQPTVFSQPLDSNKHVDMTPFWAVNAPTGTKGSNTSQETGNKPSLSKVSNQLLDSTKHVDMTPSWALNESTGAIPKTRSRNIDSHLPPR